MARSIAWINACRLADHSGNMSVRRIRFHAVTDRGTKQWQFNESNRNATPLYSLDKPLSDASLYSRLISLHIIFPSKVDYRSDPASVARSFVRAKWLAITRHESFRRLRCAIAHYDDPRGIREPPSSNILFGKFSQSCCLRHKYCPAETYAISIILITVKRFTINWKQKHSWSFRRSARADELLLAVQISLLLWFRAMVISWTRNRNFYSLLDDKWPEVIRKILGSQASLTV